MGWGDSLALCHTLLGQPTVDSDVSAARDHLAFARSRS